MEPPQRVLIAKTTNNFNETNLKCEDQLRWAAGYLSAKFTFREDLSGVSRLGSSSRAAVSLLAMIGNASFWQWKAVAAAAVATGLIQADPARGYGGRGLGP
jgi:hypothetical protein